MPNKKDLGQFYTTNYEYILNGLEIPDSIDDIVEPFVGNGDLLHFIKNKEHRNIEIYDIDPPKQFLEKYPHTIQQDTIKNPPNYSSKFIITNPPYLARNKSSKKDIFDIYHTNDLYKCFIVELIKQNPLGGILIIPLNFWSSIRKGDVLLRKQFCEKYTIKRVNVFEEQVFSDTSYAVCSFQFSLKEDTTMIGNSIPFYIYPQNKILNIVLDVQNDYTIGGELYKLPKQNKYKIGRLIKDMEANTNILLKCIDDSIHNKLGLSIIPDDKIYYDNTPNRTERSYASITIEPKLSLSDQEKLVVLFNSFLEEKRTIYNSLFLTNYRESNSIARKRISFELTYDIIGYLLLTHFQN